MAAATSRPAEGSKPRHRHLSGIPKLIPIFVLLIGAAAAVAVFFLPILLGKTQQLLTFSSIAITSTRCSPDPPPPNATLSFLPLVEDVGGGLAFMSAIPDTHEEGESQYMFFPSESSGGKLLCLSGRDITDGRKNGYAFADPGDLPPGSALLRGLTFVSSSHYNYENMWHTLAALMPLASWHQRKSCVVPARWVLFKDVGGITTDAAGVSPWVVTLMEAVLGRRVRTEFFEASASASACFERAVVFRRNEGKMSKRRREEVYGMMRCKARAHCRYRRVAPEPGVAINVTLLLRRGSRSFKDDEAAIRAVEAACAVVEGCRSRVARIDDLAFCDQVRVLGETDVLVSTHGAHLTNMIFMEKESSVMEFYPYGWKDLAGNGQYVYRWLADWSGMKHRGSWWDPEGPPCPLGSDDECFLFYKDGKVAVDTGFIANWTSDIIREAKRQVELRRESSESGGGDCDCDAGQRRPSTAS